MTAALYRPAARKPSQAPVPIAQSSIRHLTAKQVKARYGDVSEMTLWRWLHDPDLGFPQPKIINRLRYFAEPELDAFDERVAEKVA